MPEARHRPAAEREVCAQEGWLTEMGVTIVLEPFDVEDFERAVERAFSNAETRSTRPSVDAPSA